MTAGKELVLSRQRVKRASMTRRSLVIGTGRLAAAAAVSGPFILAPSKAKAKGRLVVTNYGGGYGDALFEVYYRPFAKETGIEVVSGGPADLGKLNAMVQTRNLEWDVVDPLTAWISEMERAELAEPIDYSIVDASDLLFPAAKRGFAVASNNYLAGFAWDNDRTPNGKHPSDWKEFWDIDRFPGRRSLRTYPDNTLELALLADGVPPKDIYPLDVERAFRSLARIKPHISIWTTPSPQTMQVLIDKQVDFTFTLNGRAFLARAQGHNIGFSYDQVIVLLSFFCVVKGSPNKEAAMRLIAYMMRPDKQAEFTNLTSYGPTKAKALDTISKDMKNRWLPDFSGPKSIVASIDWWSMPGRYEELTNRMKQFLLT